MVRNKSPVRFLSLLLCMAILMSVCMVSVAVNAASLTNGTYSGLASNDGDSATIYVTVSGGKITNISAVSSKGKWDSLISEVSSQYIGLSTTEQVDAVSAATSKGYKRAVKTAVQSALSSSSAGGGSGTTPVYEEDKTYSTKTYTSGTVAEVVGTTFNGNVVVQSGATVRFLNCTFYGSITGDGIIIIGDENGSSNNACTFINSYGVGLTLASNVFGTVYSNTTLIADDGVAVAFPKKAPSKTYSDIYGSLTASSIFAPSWAEATKSDYSSGGSEYQLFTITGTTPSAQYQLFPVTLSYTGYQSYYYYDSQNNLYNFSATVPMLLNIVDKTDEDINGESGLTLDKTAEQISENNWKLTLIAYAEGTKTESVNLEKYPQNSTYKYSYYTYNLNTKVGLMYYLLYSPYYIYYNINGKLYQLDYINSYVTANGQQLFYCSSYLSDSYKVDQGILDNLYIIEDGSIADGTGLSSNSAKSTNCTLGSSAVLKDIISDKFNLTDGATATAVVQKYSGSSWVDNSTLTATIDKTTKTVTVTGFDYKSHSFYGESDTTSADNAQRVVVTINGITGIQTAEEQKDVETNASGSGIYASSTASNPTALFTSPVVTIPAKANQTRQRIVVKKDWGEGTENTDKKPVTVDVKLNGETVTQLTLNSGNNWKATYETTASGTLTVKETAINGDLNAVNNYTVTGESTPSDKQLSVKDETVDITSSSEMIEGKYYVFYANQGNSSFYLYANASNQVAAVSSYSGNYIPDSYYWRLVKVNGYYRLQNKATQMYISSQGVENKSARNLVSSIGTSESNAEKNTRVDLNDTSTLRIYSTKTNQYRHLFANSAGSDTILNAAANNSTFVIKEAKATPTVDIYTYTITNTPKKFTVTWIDEDGTVLETDENVLYGTTPTYDGDEPEKAATAQYTYEFTGWTPEITPVTGDVTYKAVYTPTLRQYTVTWKDWDGEVLETDKNVPYGITPAYDGDEPEREADSKYTYEFVGWSKTSNGEKLEEPLPQVTEDVTYYAVYEKKEIPDPPLTGISSEQTAAYVITGISLLAAGAYFAAVRRKRRKTV